MATSSITHNFVFDAPETVERFADLVDILEEEREQRIRPKVNAVYLTDRKDSHEFLEKVKNVAIHNS